MPQWVVSMVQAHSPLTGLRSALDSCFPGGWQLWGGQSNFESLLRERGPLKWKVGFLFLAILK